MARKPFDLEKIQAAVYNYSNAEYGSLLRQNPPPDWYFRACRMRPEWVRLIRNKYAETQAIFAVRLQVTPKTLSSWEAGYSVPAERYIDRLLALHKDAPPAPPEPASLAPEDIRHLRQALKKSQSAFASSLGVSQVAVSLWESGKARPTGEAAETLAMLLHPQEKS